MANATVEEATAANRWEKTRLARKIGANAIATAARKRGTGDSVSSESWGTTQATVSAPSSST